ncbi:DUF4197 domain-containing protein [Chitinophaga alhagiae]|uniref:DUF4197 domain-containing protein n=1 Tax=Chitinophaga alhagiae TaxID=2203219 RepID=A0ABM6WBJ8_9BACT|nr:DUF4197 domain-containing protein [Chitinophaga alhagiae]AWO01278.1 DUF4197 domain-containing protein [Chitinophaga alhagiae]
MLKRTLLLLAGVCLLHTTQAQILKKASGILKSAGGATATGSVTENEAGMGIKEALEKGVSAGISLLNKQDGFFGNELYKVLLPPDALKAERALRSIGLGSQVDKAILQINRAAEEAVGFAKPIFVNAIKQMTITDALNLLRGGQRSATDYFQGKTTESLKSAFAPVIDSALNKTSATRYYGDLVTKYNGLPTTFNKINPDLKGYVTEKAVQALFDQIAKEELAIRQNPAARTTDLLKKVFGNKS